MFLSITLCCAIFLCYRNFSELNDTLYPDIVKQCLKFFRSEAFFLTLSNITGLRLHPLASKNDENGSEDENDAEEDTDEEDEEEAEAAGSSNKVIKRKTKNNKDSSSKRAKICDNVANLCNNDTENGNALLTECTTNASSSTANEACRGEID